MDNRLLIHGRLPTFKEKLVETVEYDFVCLKLGDESVHLSIRCICNYFLEKCVSCLEDQ